MWLVLALFGALLGSSVMDLSARGQPAGQDDGDDGTGDDADSDSGHWAVGATGWEGGAVPSPFAGKVGNLLDQVWSPDRSPVAPPLLSGGAGPGEVWVGPPPDPDPEPDPHADPGDPWLDDPAGGDDPGADDSSVPGPPALPPGHDTDRPADQDATDATRSEATDDLPDPRDWSDAGGGEVAGVPGIGARTGVFWVGPPPDPDPEPEPGSPPGAEPATGPDDPWLAGWTEDEYLSTDTPSPDPQGQVLRLGDGGGYLRGGAGDDTLIGGAGDDWIEGGAGDNLILGGAGNDTLIGGQGQSTLLGGAGNDRLIAGGGAALIFAGAGDNHLLGGEHDDTLIGGLGRDTLVGGLGDDLLIAGLGGGELDGGWGDDTLVGARLDAQGRDIGGTQTLNGGAGDDVLILGRGDLAHGGEGADSFVLGDWLIGEDPVRIVDFTPGEDRIVLSHAATGPAPVPEVIHDPATGESAIRVDGQTVALVADPDGTLRVQDIELVPHQPGPDGAARLDGVLYAVAPP